MTDARLSLPSAPPEGAPPSAAAQGIGALERLLVAGSSASGPAALEQALVREARALLAPDGSLLVAVAPPHPEAQVVASDVVRADASARLAARALRPLRDVLAGDETLVRLTGAAAGALAEALGLERKLGVVVLVPLRARETTDRVLVLISERLDAFDADQLEVARAFGQAAAAGLAQIRLAHDQAGRVAQQSAALARAAKTLNATLDPAEVLRGIGREAASILGGDSASVYLGDEVSGLQIEASFGLPPEMIGFRLGPGEGLVGRVAQSGHPTLTNDYEHQIRPAAGSPLAHVQSALAVPMRWNGRLRGVLSVGYNRPHTLEPEDLRLLEAFAELATVAARNADDHADLALVARTDALTGCANHVTLHEALRREVERCERAGHRLALVLIDLDDFKRINEEHSHLLGDQVLQRVGHALRHARRPYDLVARYGGDEFAILALEMGEADAAVLARRALDRVRDAVSDLPVRPAPGASAGIAEWAPGQTAMDLLYEADRALLAGKRDGPAGRVVVASAVPDEFRPGLHGRPAAPPSPVLRRPLGDDAREQAQRLRRRTRQLGLAAALGARLAAMTDPREILEAAVDELHRAFGFYLCAIIRLREDGYVESAAGRGPAFVRLREQQFLQTSEAGIIGRCLRERRVVLARDVTADPDYAVTPETSGTRSELCVPLWSSNLLWGVIDLQQNRVGAFDDADAQALQTVADQVGSALRGAMLYEQLEAAYLGTAEVLGAALEAKDSYTAVHARSIVELVAEVGRRLGLDEPTLRTLRLAAALHDIGKIAVPEAILHKQEPLTADEQHVLERHPVAGEQILARVDFLDQVRPLVRHGHERWDGQGYPDALRGEQIPLGSRIIFACDAHDAMTSDRPYRRALLTHEARAELLRHAGRQFDPDVVKVLVAVLDDAG